MATEYRVVWKRVDRSSTVQTHSLATFGAAGTFLEDLRKSTGKASLIWGRVEEREVGPWLIAEKESE